MRGKRGGGPIGAGCRRIIPAHAGQTMMLRTFSPPISDHPRACGANVLEAFDVERVAGSSPRMRGKRLPTGPQMRADRIIPAHAGQTEHSCPRQPSRTDHPRACGANRNCSCVSCARCGSSPRMRGKRFERIAFDNRPRIIPAHAGQTGTPDSFASAGTDHPRACGANSSTNCSNSPRVGSSPRMRGKPLLVLGELACARIIPAHAGQTLRWGRRWIRCTDHPRACGANLISYRKQHRPCGSSPRMRGKPHH